MGKRDLLEQISLKLDSVDAKLDIILKNQEEQKLKQQTNDDTTNIILDGTVSLNQTLAEMKASKKDYMA